MRQLVYCVFRQESGAPDPEPGTCHIEADNGLAAAVSRIDAASSSPEVASLLAFEKIVAAIHAKRDIVPLRYGCVTGSDAATVRLLTEHGDEYEPLLARVRGMAEMGLRVLCPAEPEVSPPPVLSPGARYLASLRRRGVSRNTPGPDQTVVADRISGLLAGCYAGRRAESSPAAGGARLLSLYFLTPKTAVDLFQRKARAIALPGIRILLSGPWPPWNFVGNDD